MLSQLLEQKLQDHLRIALGRLALQPGVFKHVCLYTIAA